MTKSEGRSVLVVDDNYAIGKMLSHNLQDGNFRIIMAANGYDCLKTLTQTSVDLILLDIKLPDFNGWGILSLLRLTETLSHIPVIMVSVEPPDAVLLDRLKPDDYVQKPFDMSDLLVRVERIMGS